VVKSNKSDNCLKGTEIVIEQVSILAAGDVRKTLPWVVVLVITLTVFLSGGCSGTAGRVKSSVPLSKAEEPTPLLTARKVLLEKSSEEICSYFLSEKGAAAVPMLKGKDLFLLGRANYEVAVGEINNLRKEGHVGMGLLPQETVDYLNRARDAFLKSADKDPEAEFVAEALYLAASVMDHGYLQMYSSAMELYKWVMISYPDSEFGEKSAKRHEILKSLFNGIEDSSHGMP
jgi:hypothetical protein